MGKHHKLANIYQTVKTIVFDFNYMIRNGKLYVFKGANVNVLTVIV